MSDLPDDIPGYGAPDDWLSAHETAREGLDLAERGLRLSDPALLHDAARSLRAAIDIHPDNPEWHLALGRVLESLGDMPFAIASYETAAHLDPADPEPARLHAQTLLSAQRPIDALRVLSNISHLHPLYEPAFCLRVRALTVIHRHDDAEEAYYLARLCTDECIRCDLAIARSLLARRQYAKVSRLLRYRLGAETSPEHLPELLLLLARVCVQESNLAEARSHLRNAIALIPVQQLTSRAVLAELWLELGLLEELESAHGNTVADAYRRAIELSPRPEVRIHLAYARWLYAQERFSQAMNHAVLAIDASRHFPGTHLLIARIHLALASSTQHLPRQVSRHLRREVQIALALPTEETDPTYLLHLSLMLSDLGKSRLALRVLKRLVEICPESSRAWQNLAVAHFSAGQLNQGVAASQRALELTPYDGNILFNLAVAHLRANQLSVAADYAHSARHVLPGDRLVAALDLRIRAMQMLGFLRRLLPFSR